MKISELITLAENRLMVLNNAVFTAQTQGNAAELDRLNGEVVETQATLDSLRPLVGVPE